MVNDFKERSQVTRDIAFRSSRASAIIYGLFKSFLYGFFLYSLFIATVFIENEVINPGTDQPYRIEEVITVCMAMIIAMMQLLHISPNIT